MKTIGLVVPTRFEAREILRAFGFQKIRRRFYKASLPRASLLLLISGMGCENGRRAAAKLVSEGARVLVSAGVCGALIDRLHVGDLVTDRLATVDCPVRTPATREALARHANAIAVDMETRGVIEEGTRLGVPIRILRVVSDESQDNLTPLLGPEGTPLSRWKIAVRLLNPSVWPLARRLKRQSETALLRLVEALKMEFARL